MLCRFLERATNIRGRQLTLWSTVAEDDEGDDRDSMKARRDKAKGKNNNEETPFDESLADSTFTGAGSPSDNGTRASDSTTGNGALLVWLVGVERMPAEACLEGIATATADSKS